MTALQWNSHIPRFGEHENLYGSICPPMALQAFQGLPRTIEAQINVCPYPRTSNQSQIIGLASLVVNRGQRNSIGPYIKLLAEKLLTGGNKVPPL